MTKEELIGELIASGYLRSPRIVAAFKAIDRADFVPEVAKEEAYENYPLALGHGQTISQPLTVAFMLELLEPEPGEKILDVGAGSGWQSALLAAIVGKTGKVIAIERIPGLARMAKNNIAKYPRSSAVAKVVVGDGSLGYKKEAPFDKIIAAASAEKIPEAWSAQLKKGGRIVAPVGRSILVGNKDAQGFLHVVEHVGFSFVPLVVK